ncbi:hypothetical protein HG530_008632 [Fusarium avenaceum]|nr:hypothetical protein HG530_008632 [Fusarium avenaceum]
MRAGGVVVVAAVIGTASKRTPVNILGGGEGAPFRGNAEHDAANIGRWVHGLDMSVGLDQSFFVLDVKRNGLRNGGDFGEDVELHASAAAVAVDG